MKAIWNKVKENPLLSVLIFFLTTLGVVFLIIIFADCPQRIFNRLGITRTEEPKYEALKFLGIGMGGLLIALQALMSYRRAKAMEDAVEKTEQGQRQERLKNAIEHLGHKSDSVRLGGAYELFHLAKDTLEEDPKAKLSQTVLDILCAHIRRTTSKSKYREKYRSKPSEEIQSLLTLLFVQEHEVFKDCHINLQGSWLSGASLSRARLVKATLSEARLQGTRLDEARLQGASLSRAHLVKATLSEARLQGTRLDEARLQGAFLFETQLQGAILFKAHLQGANLDKTQLQGAFLFETQLQGAILFETQLQGVVSSLSGFSFISFEDLIREQIGKKTDLSTIIFAGGLSQEDMDSLVKDLSDEKANKLREKLTPHIGQPESNQLPEDSGAITGSYTKEEAERWIAEYGQAVGDDS